MSISVIILAAGQGTRMKSSTPKVLHGISGKAMLFYAIDAAKAISDDITVVLSHQAQRIEQIISSEYEGIKIAIQDLTNFPGTGGALRGIEPKYAKTVILNGDMPLVTNEAIRLLIGGDSKINMSVIKLEDSSGYGRVVIENSKVLKIVEEKDCTQEQKKIPFVNAGVYAVDSDLLQEYIPNLSNHNAQKEYYLTDIIQMAVEDNHTITPVFVQEREFKGVNSKLDLSIAEEIMQERIKINLMKQGVSMRLPQTIFIDSRAIFEGECILENGVSILGKSVIKNAHIKTNSVVEDSMIINSDIGPMARVRPQSIIEDTHIGNFVEVKKSTLRGVKAGHLSYLGDCEIGEGSNIGAGVITCNYDGKKKYKTLIGKNVFVGSDSQLVAPVEIPNDVMIGAGSTITKKSHIQQGDLVMTRADTKKISHFFYKFFGKK